MTNNPNTFAELYCAQHRLDREKFNNRIIRRTLHFPIRMVGWLLVSLIPNYFEADLELVSHVGSMKSLRKFEGEIREFNADYRNRRFWRGLLRQRVSSHRLRRLFRDTIKDNESATTAPF
jgi:hypothetical protein